MDLPGIDFVLLAPPPSRPQPLSSLWSHLLPGGGLVLHDGGQHPGLRGVELLARRVPGVGGVHLLALGSALDTVVGKLRL